jgi:hypothetical protein
MTILDVRTRQISDSDGRVVEVAVPIEDWKRLVAEADTRGDWSRVVKHVGKVELPGDPLEVQRQLRSEWDR